MGSWSIAAALGSRQTSWRTANARRSRKAPRSGPGHDVRMRMPCCRAPASQGMVLRASSGAAPTDCLSTRCPALPLTQQGSLLTSCVLSGYSLAKIQENNTAEIMQVSLSEAYGAYDERCIVQLKSESSDDVDANVARIVAWVEQWRKERSEEDEADGAEGTEAQESE